MKAGFLVASLWASGTLFPGTGPAATAKPPGVHFTVSVEQDGKQVPIMKDTARLQRKPFTLVLRLREPQLVLLHASPRPESYRAAREGKPLEEIPGLAGMGAAERDGNPECAMFVDDQALNAWYYEDAKHHRFDGPCKRQAGEYICRRTVANLWFPKKRTVPIQQFDKPALYLVFARTRWKADYQGKVELQRRPLMLRFDHDKA